MSRFLQYLFDGLGNGSVYALLALGLVIIYRGTGHLNFAHGEMALLCTYVTWQIHTWGLPIALALPLGMAFGFGLGALTEVALVRPVGRKSQFAVFIVTIGLFTGLNWLDGLVAILVGLNILFTGYKLVSQSVTSLLDAALPAEDMTAIESVLDRYRTADVAFTGLRTRMQPWLKVRRVWLNSALVGVSCR